MKRSNCSFCQIVFLWMWKRVRFRCFSNRSADKSTQSKVEPELSGALDAGSVVSKQEFMLKPSVLQIYIIYTHVAYSPIYLPVTAVINQDIVTHLILPIPLCVWRKAFINEEVQSLNVCVFLFLKDYCPLRVSHFYDCAVRQSVGTTGGDGHSTLLVPS